MSVWSCHSDGVVLYKLNRFLKEKVFSIYDRQILVETGTFEDIVATGNKKFIKAYQKALAKVEKTYKSLIEERPNFVVEKILSSGEAKYKNLVEAISKDFSSIDAQKLLVAATDKGREASGKLLAKLMKDETNKELIFNIAKKAELSNEVIMDLIQSKKLKMGILKTTGGFIALGLLAVPIDHFVHKYIIKLIEYMKYKRNL
jgi:predicted DsbA family dithiol-disulfide isomerase